MSLVFFFLLIEQLHGFGEAAGLYPCCFTIVGGTGTLKLVVAFFAAGGQTNGISLLKVASICVPMFLHCGSSSIDHVD